MIDDTETIRRQMVATINSDPGSRPDLEAKHGQVWDTLGTAGATSRSSASGPARRREAAVGRSSGIADVSEHPRFYYGFSPE